MTSRRGATGLSGILPVDKPAGMTSHDVVNVVRRVTGERRVGHAGTLDPMATGVLVVLVGPATRLAPYLTGQDKEYEATIEFGTETDTDDAEGTTIRSAAVPEELNNEEVARAAVESLVGAYDQVPPDYSAIKRDGRTSYAVARGGGSPDLAARPVEVREAVLLDVEAGDPLRLTVRLAVSKGTYVRALARDLGRTLGTAAHLAALRRTRSGALTLNDARPLAGIEAATADTISALFTDPIRALGMPEVALSESDARAAAHGSRLDVDEGDPHTPDGPVALTREGRLIAVYEKQGGRLGAAAVFPGGVTTS